MSYESIPDRPCCSPYMRGLISNMDQNMSIHQSCNHAGYPMTLITNLMKEGSVESFSQFEGWLREMDSRVYLVAAPLDVFGSRWRDKTKYQSYMGAKIGEPEYTLWVGVDGSLGSRQLLQYLAMSPEENLARLDRTGIVVANSAIADGYNER
jgi:hypothetical protein